jgi:signal transduction histidine kinase
VRRRVGPLAAGWTALLLAGVLWLLAALTPAAAGDAAAPPDDPAARPLRRILLIQIAPRTTPAQVAIEQAFTSTLKTAWPDPLSFHSEYLELLLFDQDDGVEEQLVNYLAAKYARTQPDLIAVTASTGLRFTLRHRARLFPGVPVVFSAVDQLAATDIGLEPDVSGVWLSPDWRGTLDAARRLQPDLAQAFVVTGASPVDRVWKGSARAQLTRLERPIAITYLDELTIEALERRLAALPARSAVLMGAFQRDAAGRTFTTPEVMPRLSAASAAPIYSLGENVVGLGAVGGHTIGFEAQGRRAAELAVRMLRGERPPPAEKDTNVYRFDARQLKRWGLDPRRLPPGSVVLFEEPSLWRTYRAWIVAAAVVLALQTWLIIGLLVSRAQRRRAQRALAGQLRFETLVSDILAGQLTRPATAADAQMQRALAAIGADLDADRVVLAERDAGRRRIEVAYSWARDGVSAVPTAVAWREFPWASARLGDGHAVVISPLRPPPLQAEADREAMLRHGTRSLLAVPLMVDGKTAGILSCSTVRSEREWPDALIERLKLLADVFASTLARRRAEAAARDMEERFRRQRQELTHALRVNTLGELGASLAHEINQPLSAIVVNARAMSALLGRGPSEEATVREALADIAADAKRAGDIIDRLRALSRKEHVPQSGLDLDALVDDVAGLLHQDFVRRGITVHRHGDAPLPRVSGDPIQLQQIVLNVLVNAAEAVDGVERAGREITIATAHPAPRLVELAIRDTGIGAKDMDLERMFDRFVTTKSGGLGMGLAISRSIAEAHGGRIYAKANTDRGLTVYVELPTEA